MDYIKIRLSNNQYYLQFRRVKKPISFTPDSDYILYIEFLNDLNQVILSIQCSELEYYKAIESLNFLNQEFFNEYGDNLHFESTSLGSYYITIEIKDPSILSSDKLDLPYLDIDKEFLYYLLVIQNTEQGTITRLYTEISLSDIENIAYNMFNLISDLPYLDNIRHKVNSYLILNP